MAKPQQGKGTHTFSDGTYTGEWCGGKRHGQGAMTYTNGSRSVRHAGGVRRASSDGVRRLRRARLRGLWWC